MAEYIPSTWQWVADQVELYEGSDGRDGTTLKGVPVIIVTNRGHSTGATRKTPLMRVADGGNYVLVASKGGAPANPGWYYNLKADANVEIRDGASVQSMVVREIVDQTERDRLFSIAVSVWPPYQEYKEKTDRRIPIFIAEPQSE